MLEKSDLGNASSVKNYHETELSVHSYYIPDAQGLSGVWYGKLADELGLVGDVDKEAFHALADGLHPNTGGKLTQRWASNRRVGYDFTFSAPKGVSTVFGLTRDDRLRLAFEEATKDIMGRIEQDVQTRVRAGKAKNSRDNRTTGNLLSARYTHFTARPEKGSVPDPHLHSHYVLFNVTKDNEEGKLKALELEAVSKNMPIYQADFDALVAKKVSALGYRIVTTDKGFDVAIDQAVKKTLSKRMLRVKAEAQKRGITDEDQSQKLAVSTRHKKMNHLTMEELRRAWEAQIGKQQASAIFELRDKALGRVAIKGKVDEKEKVRQEVARKEEIASLPHRQTFERPNPKADALPPIKVSKDTKQVVSFQLDHMLERNSSVPVNDFIRSALKHYPTKTTSDELRAELSTRSGVIIRPFNGEDFITTDAVLREEKAMIAYAKDGIGSSPALSSSSSLSSLLNDGQNTAVNHIFSSRDKVIAIEGKAGTGKTTMMKTAVRAVENETGKGKVVVLAPTAEASRKVLREEGFSNADTVAKFLGDKDLQKSIAKGFLWVDEAGLISTPDMNKLFKIAKAQKARVILSGDTAQHRSISRGEAFAMLKRHAGLKPARLSNILRQSSNPTYRDAVANLSMGNIGAGFQALDRMGAIKSTSKGYEEVVSSHQKAREEGKSLIVVSPTHKEGKAVTDALRASLEATGELRGRGRTFRTLDNLHLTDAQKKHGGFIKRGQVLRFHRSTSGFSSGDKAKVVAKGFGWILAVDKKRLRLALVWTGTKKARGAFTVNEEARINVKRGDLIRMTANTRAVSALPQFKKYIRGDRSPTRVNNGAVHRVKATFGYQILLDNGFIFDARSGAFTHGYVTTSQASQGRTADKVILVQNSSSYANMKSQFYVSASRGRSEIEIFTDDKEKLIKSVKRTRSDVSAHELTDIPTNKIDRSHDDARA